MISIFIAFYCQVIFWGKIFGKAFCSIGRSPTSTKTGGPPRVDLYSFADQPGSIAATIKIPQFNCRRFLMIVKYYSLVKKWHRSWSPVSKFSSFMIILSILCRTISTLKDNYPIVEYSGNGEIKDAATFYIEKTSLLLPVNTEWNRQPSQRNVLPG